MVICGTTIFWMPVRLAQMLGVVWAFLPLKRFPRANWWKAASCNDCATARWMSDIGGFLIFQQSLIKQGSLNGTHFGGMKQYKSMAIWGISLILITMNSLGWWYNDPCQTQSLGGGFKFQICFMFTVIRGNDPIWLIFFKGVETTT